MKRTVVVLFLLITAAMGGMYAQQNSVPYPENFVRIQGGTFTMGRYPASADTVNVEFQHQVTVSGFYMGKYEVTQKEYQEVMGKNPSNYKGDDLPVEMVSWYDAIEYCNKRSQKEGLTPAYTVTGSGNRRSVTWNRNANGYRLPTEAEWEYACRAGTTTLYNTGDNLTPSQANYQRAGTTPVGSFAPNGWGLYDMHGNVREWCWDWYGNYSSGTQIDPVGPATGDRKVSRGGSWYERDAESGSASRWNSNPEYGSYIFGFRLVRP
jgi:formylglycine-generating enzyme required for sulfatase activity